MCSQSTSYIGRFAPSPTGPLHFGSLVAAVASYCDAKANQGKWLVRMEDVDKPREMPGAADDILRTLHAFGFEWDGDVWYQSQRAEAYEEVLTQLKHANNIYACTCSRKEIADSAISNGIEGAIYPGTCLTHPPKANKNAAFRAIAGDENIHFIDAIQGEITQNLARDIGDFVVKRADGLFAYQLAVVVDDAAQGITHVVRGADLLDSTPRQIYLQTRLGYTKLHYAHLPVAVNAAGEKLSKQTLAQAITPQAAPSLILEALRFLGQCPPAELKQAALPEIWAWACAHWHIHQVPKQRKLLQIG